MNTVKDIRIGQVLYVILKEKTTLYPFLVIEELVKKTLDGQTVSYTLRAGKTPDTIMLEDVQGDVFDSADAAKRFMIQRATEQITRVVDNAVTKASEWYGNPASKQQKRQKPQQVVQLQSQPETTGQSDLEMYGTQVQEEPTYMELPDGQKVRVRSISIAPELNGDVPIGRG